MRSLLLACVLLPVLAQAEEKKLSKQDLCLMANADLASDNAKLYEDNAKLSVENAQLKKQMADSNRAQTFQAVMKENGFDPSKVENVSLKDGSVSLKAVPSKAEKKKK